MSLGRSLAGAVLVFAAAAWSAEEKPATPEKKPATPEKKPATPDKKADAADTKAEPPKKEPVVDKPLPPVESVGDREEIIVIGGEPTAGRLVLPANEYEFRFKLSLTAQVLTLRWADLPEEERRRVQKLYGLEMRDDNKRVFGEKVTGKRLWLKSGKTIDGLPVPERARPGHVVLRTATAPVMDFAESDIERQENIESFESDFFSAQDIYQKWILEKPIPDKDAPAHLAMAQRCAKIGYYPKAIEHLQMAIEIDPQMKERNQEFLAGLIAEDAKVRVKELFERIVTGMNRQDYATAWYTLDQIERNFPNSDYASRLQSMKPQIETGMKTDLTRKVIQMSYTIASDLIQQRIFKKVRVDEKNNVVPSIPGKQVVTRQGHCFRGVLESGEAGQDMVLRVGETKLTIAAKDIMTVQDIDLSVAVREITPAFEDLKAYVCDAGRPDGLKGQMIAKISQLLKEPEAKVKEIFESRLAVDATYKDGVLSKTATYVTVRDASYGRGSWLRDGARPAPLPANQGPNDPRRQRPNWRNNVNGQQQPNPNVPKQPDPDESPDLTDDPVVWWKFQSMETQLSVLRAMAAEKVFKATVADMQCPSCHGAGIIMVMGTGGNMEPNRCPQCRGIGVMFKVTYK
ncbi:MAG: hypothetical protein NTW87_32255 [Planctomycetota bacterium]|nr:hypothetical protein [Planctomycetota bacterium]